MIGMFVEVIGKDKEMKMERITPLVELELCCHETLLHGFFNRHGGTSIYPYDTNNVSFGVGDTNSNVMSNREVVKKSLGIQHLLSAHQVHGEKVYSTNGISIEQDVEIDGYDALVTNQRGVGLMVQQADCQAVLFHDPAKEVIAAAHCGWRGSVVEILQKTVAVMVEDFGCTPVDIIAAVSPSLGPCCAEFINYKDELPEEFHEFQVQEKYFDFWRISRMQLMDAGLRDEAVHTMNICTSCSSDYFSYRRSRREGMENTGRNCSLIALR